MKSLIKKVMRTDWLWDFLPLKSILTAASTPAQSYPQPEKAPIQNSIPPLTTIPESIASIATNLTVKHGVFTGMKYPGLEAVGSAVYPKILGSYEKEIAGLIEQLCANEYTEIVDIGCAEGYYAIGLAMRVKTAKVFAFDTDERAIQLCQEMALLNNVSDRVITGSFCDSNTLKKIPFTQKALIISDCEGYEKDLFTRETALLLSDHDLLIEVHDFVDIEISSYLRDIFEETHSIDVYSSIDDIKKAQQYEYEELAEVSLATRKQILAEYRPAIMEWFYLKPRQESKSKLPLTEQPNSQALSYSSLD